MSKDNVLIIGPIGVGKSSVARELSKLTELPRIPLDSVKWYYYFKNGYSIEKDESIESFSEIVDYWKPFEVLAVEGVINDFSGAIIDFGAGHSYFPKKEHLEKVLSILKLVDNIFLLMPSKDFEESLVICNEQFKLREGRAFDLDELSENEKIIQHDSNYKIAKSIIYTKNKKPFEIAQEIYDLLNV